jgi:hypothetical protein
MWSLNGRNLPLYIYSLSLFLSNYSLSTPSLENAFVAMLSPAKITTTKGIQDD